MSNDSSTGGPLTPGASSPVILMDDALTDFITSWIAGLIPIDPTLIRPRWQENPMNQPTIGQSWLALGLEELPGDWDAWVKHIPNQPDGGGSDLLQRTEEIDLLLSFYGPAAQSNSTLLRDGMSIAQNRELLRSQSLSVVGVGKIRPAPALINNQWYKRLDMTISLRRYIVRVYPVLNLESANITLDNEVETVPINVTNN